VKHPGAAGIVAGAVGVALLLGALRRDKDQGARCGPGFDSRGALCVVPEGACPPPLTRDGALCVAPEVRVSVPAATVVIGPGDWEATHVAPRKIRVEAFRIDAFEVTLDGWKGARSGDLRAASGMTRDEADAHCRSRGGRLPTEDEWIAAAVSASDRGRRYPWGDTGAVCRRAAWGLRDGPCATGAGGPDSVGSHPDGDTPLGLHDMAGNVAEWVAPSAEAATQGVARGGSWQTELASELRVWARLELSPAAHDPRVGVRCAYPP
jgi:formylglycine-generating enzyme required for sulfatase activity